jgi:hypothetical protein
MRFADQCQRRIAGAVGQNRGQPVTFDRLTSLLSHFLGEDDD